MRIIRKAIRNLVKESVKEAMREEATVNLHALCALAISKDVDAEDLIRIVRKDKPALESEGRKFSVELRSFLAEESGDKTEESREPPIP